MRSRTPAENVSFRLVGQIAQRLGYDVALRLVDLALVCALGVLLAPSAARATWSINVADVDTKEVAVGIATCLNNIDLLREAPVLVVSKGSAAAQSFIDVEGTRRATIFNGLLNGTPPADILTALEAFPGHPTRQYGIADTSGRAVTFSGADNFPLAAGVAGSAGSLVYSIQGNIITGMPVITAAEQALLTTPGDIPAKLMAAMQAARAMGGDGRCSCPAGPEATSCGSPPPSFTNSSINGGMVVARVGDGDDPVCDANGCVDGDYFMRLNVSGEIFPNTDPVVQLQGLFDAFRGGLEGRPDAVQSAVSFGPASMTVSLLDWRGLPITVPISSLTVQHAPESDGLAAIGPVFDHGDGSFSVTLTTVATAGVDRFVVVADDGVRPVTLTPDPRVEYVAIDIKPGSDPNSVNTDDKGVIPVAILTGEDFDALTVEAESALLGPAEAEKRHKRAHVEDVDGDGDLDLLLHFRTRETGVAPGDIEACLSGQTYDGVPMMGCDSVTTVAPE